VCAQRTESVCTEESILNTNCGATVHPSGTHTDRQVFLSMTKRASEMEHDLVWLEASERRSGIRDSAIAFHRLEEHSGSSQRRSKGW
jgi:hypothetical protein